MRPLWRQLPDAQLAYWLDTATRPGRRRYSATISVDSVTASYQSLLTRGAVQADASQASAVGILQLLQDAILLREARAATSPVPGAAPSLHEQGAGGGGPAAATAATAPQPDPTPAVRGAYLWGPVGCGKTLLMDTFVASTRAALERQQQGMQTQQQQQQQHLGRSSLAVGQRNDDQACGGSGHGGDDGGSVAPDGAGGAAASHPVGRRAVVRSHFHEFMQGVHGRLHELQLARPRVVGRSRQGLLVYRYAEPEEDPLLTVAREWGRRTAILCLDELHVTDVADAMILSRLFGALLSHHSTSLLFTSNRPPRELYKGGLSRKYFEPFVRLVDEQMVVAAVGTGLDYRRAAPPPATPATQAAAEASAGKRAAGSVTQGGEGSSAGATGQAAASAGAQLPGAGGQGSWYVGQGAGERLQRAWEERLAAASRDGGAAAGAAGGGAVEVPLAYGRTLKLPNVHGDAAFLTFEQLCGARGLRTGVDEGGALAAPDYLALCRRFRTLYVEGVPRLGPAQRDEARRLVTLLDVAYDNRCRLEVAAAVAPDEVFADLLTEAARQGANPRLGLPKASPSAGKSPAGDHAASPPSDTSVPAAAAPADASGTMPAASVTAALHMQLGPSVTHGSARTNTVHPGEFTGAAAGGGGGGARVLAADLVLPRAVLAEEVLMYHRAASRLAEMCRLVASE